jgi:NAD(P)-dependent dehydrogenase (short-subunit alcohol dehydrogenase family)
MADSGRTLDGRRVLVVGASAGIGRGAAKALSRRGASVTVVGRRAAETAAAASEAGAVHSITCDVRDEEAIRAMVADAIGRLGGLDVLVYTAGTSSLALVMDTPFATWRALLEVNVIGLAITYAAASKSLEASAGRVVALSSYSRADPKAGLVPYAASKAALETLMTGLRREQPAVSFSVVTVAYTAPTEFMRDFDPDTSRRLEVLWRAAGSFGYGIMDVDDVAEQIADVVAAPMVVESVTLVGPSTWRVE